MLYFMRHVVNFHVTKGLDGFYVASAAEFAIVTQGKTLDELTKNVAEATQLYIEAAYEDIKNEWSKTPSLLMNYEIPLEDHV